MTVAIAETVLQIVAGYFAVGVLFAVLFIPFGLRRLDVVAAGGPLRFKLLIAPGVVALWPIVATLWIAGRSERDFMKRAQRRFHASIWPLIGLLMIASLAVALVVREHPAPQPAASPAEHR